MRLNVIQGNCQNPLERDAVADVFAALALEASVAVMRVYGTECNARSKSDQSPVCDADEFAEAIILAGLAAQMPDVPVLAEESAARGHKPVCGRSFILVDPVDGTREFLGRNGEFTINIALIVDGEPRAGVVYAPAQGRLWMAGATAWRCIVAPGGELPEPARRVPIHTRLASSDGLTALASRSHGDPRTEAFLAALPIKERHAAGSSLKFCVLAEGSADVYPRFGPTMEWDTAAGDAVLRAAGGIVLDGDGRPMRYGKAGLQFRNGPFVAWGDPSAVHAIGAATA